MRLRLCRPADIRVTIVALDLTSNAPCPTPLTCPAISGVEWTGSIALSGVEPRAFVHLPPPHDAPEHLEWSTGHEYGLYYWRTGPGFVQVRDRRTPGRSSRTLVDGEAHLSAFRWLM
ncbi:MAG: DUF5825 family protein, partial [Candidatus Limnocylindrales bacterium]